MCCLTTSPKLMSESDRSSQPCAELLVRGHLLGWSSPQIMGVVNCTPDSFSDGSAERLTDSALTHALKLVEEGADIIDIGGESTRPGAQPVSLDEERARVLPVLNALRPRFDGLISVDTSKPSLMREAVAAGADIINDVQALQAEGALEALTDSDVAVCLMHMQGTPQTMQQAPQYDDVVSEVCAFFHQRVQVCLDAGIDAKRLMLDPGFGFGKTLAHNVSLFQALPALLAEGFPLLVGVSRKSMLGAITGRDVEARMPASISAALLAAQAGAHVLRVHDVAETRDALAVLAALGDVNNMSTPNR